MGYNNKRNYPSNVPSDAWFGFLNLGLRLFYSRVLIWSKFLILKFILTLIVTLQETCFDKLGI